MDIENRVVCYVDILGFKNLVQKWEHDFEVSKQVKVALSKAVEWVGGREALHSTARRREWRIQVFSDSVLLSQPGTDLGIAKLIEGISYFQREMLGHGLAIRGGISVGEQFQTDLAMLSPPLVEAHHLECTEAKYPRILLADKVLKRIEDIQDDEVRKETKEHIVIDNEDGMAFICYLLFEEDDPWFSGNSFYLLHRRIIEQGFLEYDRDDYVRSKYSWMGTFHNWCLEVTAKNLKRSEILTEDDVWDFRSLVVKGINDKGSYESLLWKDRAYVERQPVDDSVRRLHDAHKDWINRWPGNVRTEDDEAEPDMERDDGF